MQMTVIVLTTTLYIHTDFSRTKQYISMNLVGWMQHSIEIFLSLPLFAQLQPDCEESNSTDEMMGLAPLYTRG